MIDDRLREELNALVDGELAEERAAELHALLETDPALQAEFDRLRRVADLVRSMPAARANLADEVMAALPPAPGSQAGSEAQGRVVRPWAWGGAFAAAAAAVLVGVLLLNEADDEQRWTEAREPARKSAPVSGRSDSDQGDMGRFKSETVKKQPERDQTEQLRGLSARSEKKLKRTDETKGGDDRAEATQERGAAEEKGARRRAERASQAAEVADGMADAESRRDESPKDAPSKDDAAAREARTRRGAASGGNLLRRVESKGVSLGAAERAMYLRMIGGLADKDLEAHLQRVGRGTRLTRPAPKPSFATKEKAKARAKASEAAWSFEVTVSNAEEANAVRSALKRAFRSGAAPSARDAGKVKPRSFTAQVSGKKGGELRYEWDATPIQAGALVVWLDRIGLSTTGAKAGVRPGEIRITAPAPAVGKLGTSGTAAPASPETPAVPVRLRIRYGQPVSPAERSDSD